jgi:hypothetical protein
MLGRAAADVHAGERLLRCGQRVAKASFDHALELRQQQRRLDVAR